MYETYGVFALVLGVVLSVIGYCWLFVRAWLIDWRLAFLFVFIPLVIPVFVIVKFRRVWVPALLLLTGVLLVTGTVGMNLYLAHRVDLGPREKIVDGALHITVTGWDESVEDYAVLATKRETIVLQMANPDVTDDTLQYLAEMSQLEELDLNDTQITDAGLATLARLPRLRVLRLRGTKVTDQGFQNHLAGMSSLHEVDARETEIASKSLRQWKNGQKDVRRYLK
jgi:hypothetical protein